MNSKGTLFKLGTTHKADAGSLTQFLLFRPIDVFADKGLIEPPGIRVRLRIYDAHSALQVPTIAEILVDLLLKAFDVFTFDNAVS